MANIQIWNGSSQFAPGQTPFGFYDTDTEFASEADKVAKYCAIKLGWPLMDVELTISSAMAQTTSTLGKVMSWQAGDFIPLEMSEIVTLDIEGTPSFTATLGSANEKRALKIIKTISY